jgi:DNA-binding IclR family transcriptional regulator
MKRVRRRSSPAASRRPRAGAGVSVRDSGHQTPALDRALAVMEFVSGHPEGVTRQEIRDGLGLTTNLVFRLTRALLAHGYVEILEPGRRLVLTRKMLAMSQPKRDERSLVQLAYEPLRWLRDATGESAHVGVRVGNDCLVLDRVIGSQPYKCYVEAGTMGPLHAAAPGKALLAWLPALELDEILADYPFRALTATTITSRRGFTDHLRLVRQRGYALDLGETMEGHHCLGAPILDASDRAIASLWITAPAPRLAETDGPRLAPAVIRAAEMVTEVLR